MGYNDYIIHLESLKRKPFWRKRGFHYHILRPENPFTEPQVKAMLEYATSQLGRQYMLRGYWQNREVRGIMCSQYVGNILEKSGLIKSANYKESPGSLYNKLRTHYE
jgi:hypothetical protein